jgi:prepilin-type N-terminal cleavage/methylation domain-containing protein
MNNRARSAGFTLVELLVVIAIIGILAALLLPMLAKARCHAREGTTQAMIKDVETALKAYELDFGTYPPTQSGYVTSGTNGLVNILRNPGPRGLPYYEFRSGSVDPSGQFVSILNFPIYYCNASQPMGRQMRRMTFDMWTQDCENVPDGINNWK